MNDGRGISRSVFLIVTGRETNRRNVRLCMNVTMKITERL